MATAMYGKMFKQLQDTTWPNSIIQSYIYTVFKPACKFWMWSLDMWSTGWG